MNQWWDSLFAFTSASLGFPNPGVAWRWKQGTHLWHCFLWNAAEKGSLPFFCNSWSIAKWSLRYPDPPPHLLKSYSGWGRWLDQRTPQMVQHMDVKTREVVEPSLPEKASPHSSILHWLPTWQQLWFHYGTRSSQGSERLASVETLRCIESQPFANAKWIFLPLK